VRLVAQQADRSERRLELELLATVRGPRSEFAAHGAAAFLGFTDEGTGLAYSPDGRWLALPGPRGEVELRDLHRADPTVPCRLLGERAEVRALHFLDAGTLLVARGDVVECFDCTKATVGEERAAIAAIPGHATESMAVLAIEPAGERSVFVGFAGAEVERWTFTAPSTATSTSASAMASTAAPSVRREAVRAATFEVMSVQRSDGKQQDLRVRRHPSFGWLLGSEAGDRCVVRWPDNREVPSAADALWQRGDDGTWREQPLPPLPREFARQARWRTGEVDGLAWDEVAFGQMMARPRQGGGHGAVAGFVGITFGTTRTLGMCHDSSRRFVHGFSPDGRFYAYCAPGHRVLARVPEAEAAREAKSEASNDAPHAPTRCSRATASGGDRRRGRAGPGRPLADSPGPGMIAAMALPKLDVDALTPAERLLLIEQLWDSLDEEDVPLTEAQQAELAKRIADLEANPADQMSWEAAERFIRGNAH